MTYSINRVGVGIMSPLNVYNSKTPCNILEGAVGSLIGGVAGSIGQASANRANLQITRENNEANQQLAQKQNQWNIDQWNRENEYNSASAQVQRLQKAGLNPYFNEVTAGSASSVQSANLANQQAAGPMGNVGEPLGRGLAAAGQSIFDSIMTQQLTSAQVKKANAEAVSAEAKANLDAANASWLNDTKPDTIAGLQLKNQGMVQTNIGQALSNHNMELRNIQQEGINTLTKLQIENDKLQLSLQQQFGQKFKQAELDKIISEKGQIDSSTNVNVATLSKIASDIAKNYAEVNHLNADTTTINSLRPYIIRQMGIQNIGGKLSNLSTAFDIGLNLKYGDKQKGQQLKTQEYENSFAGRARSWLNAFSSILGVALGGTDLIKGQKGSSKKVGTRKTTDVYSNDELVKSIVEHTNDVYE